MQQKQRSVPKRHQASRERSALERAGVGATAVRLGFGAGITTKGILAPGLWEPPLFSHLGKGLLKQARCKSHSSQSALSSCHYECNLTYSPLCLTPIRAATHQQPHFSFWLCVQALGIPDYTVPENNVYSVSPLSFPGYLLQHLNWKATAAHKNMKFTIQKQYSFNNYCVFSIISHHSTLILKIYPLYYSRESLFHVKIQLNKCSHTKILSTDFWACKSVVLKVNRSLTSDLLLNICITLIVPIPDSNPLPPNPNPL